MMCPVRTAEGNTPGGRYYPSKMEDAAGNKYIFAGFGDDRENDTGFLNDLWRYNPVSGNWTWISGNDTDNPRGGYGTRNVESAANIPGGRFGAASWSDSAGNLWVFGGAGISADASGSLDDLWRYNVSTGYWTWVAGTSGIDTQPVYGTPGTGSPDNTPGARLGCGTWTDMSGNLWLYGGQRPIGGGGTVNASDLWRFDVANRVWILVNNTGDGAEPSFGTKGVPASSNSPGRRVESATWKDTRGNLWLFGGALASEEFMNDVWSYDIASGLWTWVSGSSAINPASVYSTKGAFSVDGTPCGRRLMGFDSDSNGNLIIYGGEGIEPGTATGRKSDMWKYDIHLNGWTWLGGSTERNAAAVHGTQGVPDAANVPGGLHQMNVWVGENGQTLLFGGARSIINGFNSVWQVTTTYSTDIGVTLGSVPPGIILGQPVSYTATVTNSGVDPAENVVMSVTVPPEAIQATVVASQGVAAIDETSAGVVIGSLAPGATATLTVNLTPTVPGMIPLSAQVGTSTPDANQANDTALLQVQVTQGDGPDLSGTGSFTAQCRTKRNGTTCNLRGTVTLTNSGNQNAGKHTLTVFLSDDRKLGDGDTPLKTLNVKKLKTGRSANKRINAKLPPTIAPSGKFVISAIDQPNAVVEGNEFNNVSVFGPLP